MKRTILALTLIAAGASGAHAYGSSTRDIDAEQAREAARIEQGIRNGSINRWEATRLKQEQRTSSAWKAVPWPTAASHAASTTRSAPRRREPISTSPGRVTTATVAAGAAGGEPKLPIVR